MAKVYPGVVSFFCRHFIDVQASVLSIFRISYTPGRYTRLNFSEKGRQLPVMIAIVLQEITVCNVTKIIFRFFHGEAKNFLNDPHNLKNVNSLLIYFSVSLYGYCWQMGEIKIRSPYIYRNDVQVDATLGIRVGLRTINLTLSGTVYCYTLHVQFKALHTENVYSVAVYQKYLTRLGELIIF